MQARLGPLTTAALGSSRPTVGDLMVLGEENYALLNRLVPSLPNRRGLLVSRVPGAVDLHLTIESQSPYTTVIRLTHVFGDGETGRSAFGSDPDVQLRVYHDARQVEVLDLRQTALPLHADYQPPALHSKWRLSLFLAKWLSYCLYQGHRFASVSAAWVPVAEDDDLACPCG
jgi:uncharacterized protein YqiB (DUF1249 family)